MAERGSTPTASDGPVTTGVVSALCGARLQGDPDVVLSGATHDSREVRPGDLYCCVVGASHDGHDFAAQAVVEGAAALLVQRVLDLAVPQLVVTDARAAMAPAAAAIHGEPSAAIDVVGVTGTNGKTTVVSLLGHILAETGHEVEVMGTLTGARTTPEATEVQRQLAEARDRGVTHVAMEVSSHALELHRVDSVHFAVGVFTNLGADHLDFHGTADAYFAAKARLFEAGRSAVAVLNLDDPRGRSLAESVEVPVVGYSVATLEELHLHEVPARFRWRGQDVALPMAGAHNVSNALAAAESAVAVGVDPAGVARALRSAAQVPGRFERVDNRMGATVVVDYAHTPDALEAALVAASDLRQPGGEVWVVFGCGGDRDQAKRPQMGAVASSGADHVVVTSDNPRSEDPLRIIEAIRSGCTGEPIVEPDRRAAIAAALGRAGDNDVVLIAGKGHEQGQVFADRTEPIDDRDVARELLRADGAADRGSPA